LTKMLTLLLSTTLIKKRWKRGAYLGDGL